MPLVNKTITDLDTLSSSSIADNDLFLFVDLKSNEIKNIAASEPLITIGLTFVISKKRDIGIPPKVPRPLIIPETPPAKNLTGNIFIFLFEYPLNCKITKKIIIPQIEKWTISGDKIFNK